MVSSATTPVAPLEQLVAPTQYVLTQAYTPEALLLAVPDESGVITIAPRRSTQLILSLISGVPLLALLAIQALQHDDAVLWVFPGAFLVLFVGINLLSVSTMRVVITPQQVGLRRILGTRWFDRASLGRLLVARGYDSAFSARGGHADAFLFDMAGKRVIRLSGQLWDEPRIQAFHAALGLPTRVRQGPTRRRDLKLEEPGALDWPEAHPVAFIAIALSAIFVVTILFVAVGIALLVHSIMS